MGLGSYWRYSGCNYTIEINVIELSKAARVKVLEYMDGEGYTTKTSALRVQVLPGGCSGFSYSFQVEPEDKILEDDLHFDLPDDIEVVIDPFTAQYVEGTMIDYQETMMQSGFTFNNPNSTGACGCGESFSA